LSYSYSKIVPYTFDEAVIQITARLKEQGFGVLTEINMQSTLKQKLDADLRPYTILGACNPPFALKALQAEGLIGLMLPCNVVVREKDNGSIEVAAINPIVSMQTIGNDALSTVATEVSDRLKKVIALV
jgi:uncharacterized protein (DUF302 family)